MTSSGRRIAFFVAILIVLALPMRVKWGYAGAPERSKIVNGHSCSEYELEPVACFLLEKLLGHDVGFAYSRGDDC
jgi:hypothetical protein